MTEALDHYLQQCDDDFERQGESFCNTCFGQGFVVKCMDDMCHGLGYCMHGDGNADCPDCDNEWDYSVIPE